MVNPNKSLIFLDIDGTLIDNKYQTNCDGLKVLIKNLAKKDIIFGLNSNRSLEDLLPVAKKFDITGPIIGENGAFVYMSSTGTTHSLLPVNLRRKMSKLRKIFRPEAERFLREKYPRKNVVYRNLDTVDAIIRPHKYDFPSDSLLILNNKFRKFTISAHIREFREENLIPAKKMLEELVDYLKKQFAEDKDLVISYSLSFCNVLIYSSAVSKRLAIEKLKKKFFNSYRVYAIGDELSDFNMVNGIGSFFTISNASTEVKNLAGYVSPFNYTQGVIDILKRKFS